MGRPFGKDQLFYFRLAEGDLICIDPDVLLWAQVSAFTLNPSQWPQAFSVSDFKFPWLDLSRGP